ncbi:MULTISPECIES: hypothetical protein [unclassified Prochlorococcus]|uniref:hypothetical protein n=1 Tax=unclassified Prochlorococcus TaxID=2627481 RepID=UPI0005337E4C|nr:MULTISPECIES: hypothetical protein [unclassified Prochlorococcus]KGG14648.1 hypothetical protein EV06_1708 [Prochlorococcus sp. MIT 0602]
MSSIKEHDYLKICAQLASFLSISISAAKKKIDVAAASKGVKDLVARKEIAEKLLEEARQTSEKGENSINKQLDNLLEALAEEENFMVED